MLSLTERFWEFRNDALWWDTHKHALFTVTEMGLVHLAQQFDLSTHSSPRPVFVVYMYFQ